MTLSALSRPDGTVEGTLVHMQDLTEQRKMEASVKHAEKMAALGKMAAGMAHEIRNPLASISGAVQVLQNEADLNKTRTELTEAQRDLAAWKALTIPVDQVRSRLAELIEVKKASEVLEEEKKVLIRNLNNVKTRLAIYEGDVQPPPELPPGLKGKVVAVDPKWDFVVLDIGGNQGLVERGEMLVSRDGKLVAKIRVTSVEPSRSVANILPGWKQAEVMEGDVVLH